MSAFRRFLSREAGAFAQFVKYAVIGVLSTFVQLVVFYLLASTVLKCLTADDWAVRFLRLPAAEVPDGARAVCFPVATALAFCVSNLFCWVLNRLFVFTPGRYVWYKEFLLFVGVSAFAMALAALVGAWLISSFGVMTSFAAVVQIVFSFALNYLARRFVIFVR